MHLGVEVPLGIVELLFHLIVRLLDALLELHLLMATGTYTIHRLDILRRRRLRLRRRLAALLLLLHFNHLFLRALQLLQESRECLHDLLTNSLKVILVHVQGVRAVRARIADLQVLAGALDSVYDLSQEIAFKILEMSFQFPDNKLYRVVDLKGPEFEHLFCEYHALTQHLVLDHQHVRRPLVLLAVLVSTVDATFVLRCHMRLEQLDEAEAEARVVVA